MSEQAMYPDEDGSILRAVEGALFSVAMDRGRGEKISDQAEAVRVSRAVRATIASTLAAPVEEVDG